MMILRVHITFGMFNNKSHILVQVNEVCFRYPNARQYKTVASALVKSYPFLESSTDGGEVSDQKKKDFLII